MCFLIDYWVPSLDFYIITIDEMFPTCPRYIWIFCQLSVLSQAMV